MAGYHPDEFIVCKDILFEDGRFYTACDFRQKDEILFFFGFEAFFVWCFKISFGIVILYNKLYVGLWMLICSLIFYLTKKRNVLEKSDLEKAK